MTNSTVITQIIYDYTQLFVDVSGIVIGGWVGFGIFIALFILTLALTAFKILLYGPDFYQLSCYTMLMIVVYLLAACEQFVMERDNHDHVNLLMIVANAVVWLWAVLLTARRTSNRPSAVAETYVLIFGVISQLLFVISAFVWNGAVFALWAFSLIIMLVAIGHYGYFTVSAWAESRLYSRQWLFFALAYTLVYVFIAFLSHLYLAVLSLSGAIWAYLFMHLMAYAWLLFSSRVAQYAPITFDAFAPSPPRERIIASYDPSLLTIEKDVAHGD